MDVLPNEEEQMVKNLAREFLEAECPPRLARDMEKDDLGYPPELWKQMADLGWLGISLPEQYGGQGLPLTYLGLITEELGRAIAPVPFHSTMVAALTVAEAGNEELRQSILPRVSRGDLVLAWAFPEENPRLLPEAVNCQATEDGDNFVLNGTKMFVDNFVAAEKCLVACRTAPATEGSEGISLLLVDTGSTGVSHISLTTLAKDKQSKVTFNNVRVPKANLVGELNQGWPAARKMLDRGTAPPVRPDCRCGAQGRRDGHRIRQEPRRLRSSHSRIPVHPAYLRRHDPLGRRRAIADVRGPVEDGPGPAGIDGGLPGQGIL